MVLLSQGWLSRGLSFPGREDGLEVTQEITGTLLRVWPCPAQRNAKQITAIHTESFQREKEILAGQEREIASSLLLLCAAQKVEQAEERCS